VNPELNQAKTPLNRIHIAGHRQFRFAATFVTANLLASLLAACASPPAPVREEPLTPSMTTPVTVNETAMLPLLGYAQLLGRMSAQDQARERTILTTIPKTPITQVRLAMLLAQPRGPMDLARALALLESVLKSPDPVAVSLQPLVQTLATQYSERLKLDSQSDKLSQQLKEMQGRNAELQDKLNALADIERSLPVRPNTGEMIPGTPR